VGARAGVVAGAAGVTPVTVRHLTSLSLATLAVTWSTRVAAQDSAAVQTEVVTATAPVMLDGATIFRVRGISSYPAERRAAEIAGRIEALASDRAFPAESVTVKDTTVATFILGGGRRLFAVFDADAAVEGLTRQVLAEAYRTRVVEAMTQFRRDREAAALWEDLARAAAATLGFVLFIALGRRVLRRVRALAETRYRTRVHDVQFQTIDIMRGEQLWNALQNAVRGIATIITLAAGYAYVDYVLLLFPWTRAFGNSLASMLLQPLATLGTGFVQFIPSLLFLIALAFVVRFFMRLNRIFFRRITQGAITFQGFDPEWAQPTERIARFAIIAFALVVAYPYIPGSSSDAFKGIGLVIGLMFSLGSPSVIGNLVAGLSLAFRRAFRVGDRVRIGEHIGEVAQVRLLTTYLRSPKNEQIVIPNSIILNSEVVNFSTLAGDAGLILHTNVGIGYETPWRQVEAILIEAARRTPGLRTDPEPFVLQRKLGDFAVDYELNAYTDDPARMLRLYSALHRNILDAFNEYGIQIMTPAYEQDPAQPKIVPRDQWFTRPAAPPSSDRVVETPVPTRPADVSLGGRADGRAGG
jgi:small-conductance mechanosensitive channel